MKCLKNYIGLFLWICILSSCIKNDIPYPYIIGEITAFEVEGQGVEAVISKNNRTVTVFVGDTVDIENLRITKFVVNEEAVYSIDSSYCTSPRKFPDVSFDILSDLPAGADTRVNFSQTVPCLLSTYQDFQWMITVKQNMNRVVKVEGQVGSAVIDSINHSVIVYVSNEQDLSNVKITELSLGGSKSTISPDPSTVTNFRRPQLFVVTRFGKEEKWAIDVVRTSSTGNTGNMDVWATRVTLNGGMKQGSIPTVEYRKKAESAWTAVDAADVKLESATTFSTVLTGLQDGTSYVWRVVVEDIPSAEAEFTTEKIQEIPNLNFDTWSQNPSGSFKKSWYPNEDGTNSYWATGNDGVTSTLAGNKDSSTRPEEKDVVSGKAAYMVTLGNVPLVGVAAGNLFIGDYKTNANSPKDSPKFGRSFIGARPTGLKGWYKYTSKPIDYVGIPADLKNDECHIYLRLWDAKDNEIAYGEFVGKETVTKYTEFKFDVIYSNKSAIPAKITIVATSSHYGGDFTGAKVTGSAGIGSELWVDEFELLYE
ncbi:PCMD domain-containing protein [Bacteroides sp.]